jgi:hypothetical protein
MSRARLAHKRPGSDATYRYPRNSQSLSKCDYACGRKPARNSKLIYYARKLGKKPKIILKDAA